MFQVWALFRAWGLGSIIYDVQVGLHANRGKGRNNLRRR